MGSENGGTPGATEVSVNLSIVGGDGCEVRGTAATFGSGCAPVVLDLAFEKQQRSPILLSVWRH